jgi:hypothetical protein
MTTKISGAERSANGGKRMVRAGSRSKTLGSWLRSIVPAYLMVEDEEGEERKVKVPTAKTGKLKVAQLTETIDSLKPEKATAYDKDGTVLGVWDFPDRKPELPGYTASAADDKETRILKVFAHLLADAHRVAGARLESVVDIQAKNFAEERKAFASTLMSMDRMTQRLGRQVSRLRGGEDDGEGGREEEDTTVSDMVKQALMSKVGAVMTETTPAPGATSNGKAKTS